MTLPDNVPTRKQRFSAALALAGLTLKRWRLEHHAVSAPHLHKVLDDERPGGAELEAAIDRLIAKYLPDSPEAQAAQEAESDEPTEAKIA